MGRPWYRADPAVLPGLKADIERCQPTMHMEGSRKVPTLIGEFQICENGVMLDSYLLEIELPAEKNGIPRVLEAGNRIPRELDRHIDESGSACVVLPEEYWYKHPEGMALTDFLDGPLRRYLAAQSVFEIEEEWPGEEWGHGVRGPEEFYAEVLGVPNLEEAVGWVNLLRLGRVGDHHYCPCRSGKVLRRCHPAKWHKLRSKVPVRVANRWWKNLPAHVAARAAEALKDGER